MDTNGFTTLSIEGGISKGTRPEWLRVADAVRYSSISRSLLYELLKAGQVESRVLRKRGRVRGIRLVSVDSLNQFIKALPSGKHES
jgi:hypothetical protein